MRATHLWSALLFGLICVAAVAVARAQDKSVPLNERQTVEMLTLDGAQPPTGAGIVSFGAGLLFQRGATKIVALDEKVELRLPPGYVLYNKMKYGVMTKATVSGPYSLIVIVPAADRAVFDRLRVLHGVSDDAEPDKLRWIDITVSDEWRSFAEQYITAARFNKLLPDFSAKTIGGLTQDGSGAFAVALKDEARARDRSVADLAVTGATAPEQVMEGRPLTYTFKVTNKGPEAATDVHLHTQLGQGVPDTAAAASQGVCRYYAGNVYCNLGEIAAGASATVTINTRCGWGSYSPDRPGGSKLQSSAEAFTREPDTDYENNRVFLLTTVVPDPNQAPEVKIISPDAGLRAGLRFKGPATVTVLAEASDPDGAVAKVEFFDQGVSIGTGTLVAPNRYRVVYERVPVGRHWLTAVATDNQGRDAASSGFVTFIVNGPVEVEIVSPKPKTVFNPPLRELSVAVHAKNPTGGVKQVLIHLFEMGSGGFEEKGVPADEGVYTATFKRIPCSGTCMLLAVATDDAGVESTSALVEFKVNEAPTVSLYTHEGDMAFEIKDGSIYEPGAGVDLIAKASDSMALDQDAAVTKVDFYADGKLIGTDVNEKDESGRYRYRDFRLNWKGMTPGSYTLTVKATDNDGATGTSKPVRVVVRAPAAPPRR